MHESCKNNPICWARTGGAAGRAAPPGLCNQVSGNADFGTGMDARVQGCTGAPAAKDMARRMHVLRACLEKRRPGGWGSQDERHALTLNLCYFATVLLCG